MTLAFGAPWALAGLAALAVPLLLHLERRRTPRLLPFAALRWLGRARPARRTPRLVEAALLALRLALFAAVVLWLAAPRLEGWTEAPRDVLLVAPGAAVPALPAPPREAYWLAPGFPPLAAPMPEGGPSASLLREFDAALAPQDALAVRVPREFDGLDASALELGRTVDWQVVAGASPASVASPAAPRRVAVRHAAPDEPALAFVRAAAAAWNAAQPGAMQVDIAPAGTPLPPAVDAVLWFGDAPDAASLARLRDGATLLQVPGVAATQDEADAPDIVVGEPQREGRGWRRRAPQAWNPSTSPSLFDAGFPAQLKAWLSAPPDAPTRAHAADVAPSRGAPSLVPPKPLQPALAWLIAALFLLERAWANGRRLGRPA
jgi:hypothetical protein